MGMPGFEYYAHPWEFGAPKAKELLLTGAALDADEAYRLGMVSKIFRIDELADKTLEFARRITERPTMAAMLIKDSVNAASDAMGFTEALRHAFHTSKTGATPSRRSWHGRTRRSPSRSGRFCCGRLIERGSPKSVRSFGVRDFALQLSFQDRTHLVTGARNGIGKGIAAGLVAAGASVMIVGRNADRLATAVKDIEAGRPDGAIRYEPAGVTDKEAARAVDAATAWHGWLRGAVHYAGGRKSSSRSLQIDS